MGGKTGNLVTETLGGDDGNLTGQTLVGLEVQGQARVVLFDKDTGGLLDRLGANTTLIKYEIRWRGWMDGREGDGRESYHSIIRMMTPTLATLGSTPALAMVILLNYYYSLLLHGSHGLLRLLDHGLNLSGLQHLNMGLFVGML